MRGGLGSPHSSPRQSRSRRSAAPTPGFAEDKKTIKVGIISGEDEDVWRVVTQEAAKRGLTIETVVFNDYTQPNEALERGEIDANAFQHQPYLDNQIKTQGYHIVRGRLYRRVADRPLLEEVCEGRRPA